MANRFWKDFRPRGLASITEDVAITEGAAPTVWTDFLDDSGLAAGYYRIQVAIEFTLPTDKYMEFTFTLNGGVPKVYRWVSHVSDPYVNLFQTEVYLPILTGNFNWDMSIEFPDQAGAASGALTGAQVAYEKWGDFPTP